LPLKEAKPSVFVYFNKKNGKHLVAIDNQLQDANGKILSRNAIETVGLIRKAQNLTVPDKHQENLECGKMLVRLFGEERGQAATLYGYREMHCEDIKNYKHDLEKAELDKLRQREQPRENNRQSSHEANQNSRANASDKNKDRDYGLSR
jgi:hypothetical protein